MPGTPSPCRSAPGARTSRSRRALERLGTSRKEINRWLSGEVLYGYRSPWAALMDQLSYGWTVAEKGSHRLDLHKHVAFYGDWALPGNTMDTVYAKLHPGALLAIAGFERAEDVYERFSREVREDLDRALASSYAVSLLHAYNHPSGDAAPSEEDVRITRDLQRAAELLEIPIMDHIVLGEPGSYTSFYELGLLDSDLEAVPPRKKRKRRS
ncbi:MAG TPA: JAB domain-containing protein [Longimicrobiaceae bacterium]|nr:JAB domain-containing protein [Longimicrobiaceae bacterium]